MVHKFIWLFVSLNIVFHVPFGVQDTTESGASLLFDTMAYLKYPVAITKEPITEASAADIHIILQPYKNNDNSYGYENMFHFVENGGRLVLLTENHSFLEEVYLQNFPSQPSGPFQLYEYGKGQVLIGRSSYISNDMMKESYMEARAGGFAVIKTIDEWGAYDTIYFNEYYHRILSNIDSQDLTLWQYTPSHIRLMIYESMIALALFLYFYGRRFGSPVPYYEDIEREENEYLKTIASLYKHSGQGEAPLASYLTDFSGHAARYFNTDVQDIQKNLVKYWESSKLSCFDEAKEIAGLLQQDAYPKYNTKRARHQKNLTRTLQKVDLLNQTLKESGKLYGNVQ